MTLRDLGLDADLERLYRLLLGLAEPRLARVAEAIGWTPARTERMVAQLADLGLIRVRGDEILVIEPASAVGSLIERVEDELIARYRQVSATRSSVAEIVGAHATVPAADDAHALVQQFTDLEQLRDKIEELSFFTRTSLSAMHSGGPASREALEASRPLDHRGLRRGISMRLLYTSAVLATDVSRDYLHELAGRGAQVRIAAGPTYQMLIMDGEVAVVPIDHEQPRRGALVVRHPVLLSGFQDLFERTWAEAAELAEAAAPDVRPQLSDQDRAVLKLLGAGTTDEVAARELGISVRHLRRHISRLMDDLAASSRFEAGVEAARRGWI